MKKLISKLKIFGDYGTNVVAFGVLIFVQHYLMFPYIAKMAATEEFSFVIIFFSINAIVSVVIGYELGTTTIVNKTNQKFNLNNYTNFFYFLLSVMNTLAIAAILIIDAKSATLYTCLLIMNLSTLRLYLISEFRRSCEFENILITNIFYAIGAIIGMAAMHLYGFFLLPLVIAEVVSVIYLLRKTEPLFTKKAESKWLNKSALIDYASLASISGISSTVMYADRLILSTILNLQAVAVYFAASAMSKFLLLLVNPISNVMLSKLALSKNNNTINKQKTIIIILLMLPILSIVAYMIALVALKVLYPQFYIDSVALLLPISLASGFSSCSALIKPFIIILKGPVRILYIQIAQTILLFAFTLAYVQEYKLYGFACFVLITNMFELAVLLYSISPKNLKQKTNLNTLNLKN